jgi:hypothetical protein
VLVVDLDGIGSTGSGLPITVTIDDGSGLAVDVVEAGRQVGGPVVVAMTIEAALVRAAELVASGAATGDVLIEVPIAGFAAGLDGRVRAGHFGLAALVGRGDVPRADDEDGRGRLIGLLTVAIADGSRVVRAADVRTARRVAAVVEAVREARGPDARMAP